MRLTMYACRRALAWARRKPVLLQEHVDATYAWLCAAQDATRDGGVAGCYHLIHGWTASYPDTTGYIIPTVLHYGLARNSSDAFARALRMADWEMDIQLPNGAARRSMLGKVVSPSVFNTGQVLFGWVAACQASGEPGYVKAAAKAARWLTSVQDADGAWRKYVSLEAHNVRSAWGLAVAGTELNEPRWTAAAMKNCDWVIAQQAANGWFAHNSPFLHTIAYVIEGLLGTGELLGREKYINAAIAAVAPLMDIVRQTGELRGRYNAEWEPMVSWRCVNGETQVALVLERIGRITGESSYSEMAQTLLENIARLQEMSGRSSETYGGLPGSNSLWGGYGSVSLLNWTAKFFLDAVLLKVLNVDVQRPVSQPAVTLRRAA